MGTRVLDFFDGFTSASVPSAVATNTYDVIISSGGEPFATHASWTLALADIANGDQILVLTDTAIASQINFTFSNCVIHHAGDVDYTKSGASIGFNITGNDNKFYGGRFSGFNGGSDKAIQNSGNRNRFRDINFNSCTNEIADSGTGTDILGCMTE